MLLKSLLLFLLFQLCSCSRDTITWNEQLKDVDGAVLVSKASNFVLGFFSPSSSCSKRYIGIWYSQSKVSKKTIVWTANRDNPINDTSGVFTINKYGELALYGYSDNILIWSTNVSQLSTLYRTVQILDNGNLVMFLDGRKNGTLVLWQSFDYPTDTVIQGMRIGLSWKQGIDWAITSWKSQDDPGMGHYAFRLYPNRNATPQFYVYKGFTKYWRMDVGPLPYFYSNADEMYFDLPYYRSDVIMILRLKYSGLFQHMAWNRAEHQWVDLWSAPKYPCDWYGHCGANSKCSPDNINSFDCECIPGYEPKSVDGWNQRDGRDGCVIRRVGVSKCRNGEGFVKVARVKDPDTSDVALLRKSTSIKECEQECLNNCSCKAYMSITLEGVVDCLTWYDDLRDILIYTKGGRDLYVRVDKVALAEVRNSKDFLKSGEIFIPILTSLVTLVLIIVLALWLLKKTGKTRDYLNADELEESKRHPELQFFALSTIIAATDNFSDANKLGQGGFGIVYKAKLPNDQKFAIKRLSKTSGQGIEEFKNEVALVARLQHKNLVKLLGCCIKEDERILVLEYMPNNSLSSLLFDSTGRSLLDWQKRFKIINGIARGVLYLHEDSRLRIIHRDLKTSNVLLDADLEPKISDFGIARIFEGGQLLEKTNRIAGTYGYMPPEYAVFGRFSTKSDVFSLGIILLEIISGKRTNDYFEGTDSLNLIGHVWQLWNEDRVLEILDSSLETYELDVVMRCIQVALLCVQEETKDRPSMSVVVFMLSGETSLPSPKQPAFVFRTCSSSREDPSIRRESDSRNNLTITNVEAR